MRRRDFITLLGGAAATWPLAAQAQQSSAPTVGFLVSASAAGYEWVMGPILKGLEQAGYVQGKNLSIEYRWADYHYDRLPSLAAELVNHNVAVIFTTGSIVSALAAKSATSTIPIVFANGSDPVKYGLVASLNRPGGNVTGVTFYNSSLGPKRIGLLREILPKAVTIGLLVNPNNPNAQDDGKETGATAGDWMKRFVEGVGRGQTTLFPECLEDWIDEGNPVRAIDTFVEKLDLRLARNDANGQGPAVACSIVGGGAE